MKSTRKENGKYLQKINISAKNSCDLCKQIYENKDFINKLNRDMKKD